MRYKLLVIGQEGRLQKYTKDFSVYDNFEISYVPTGSEDTMLLEKGRDADFILVDAMGRVPGAVIEQMPNLKMIHSEGVGYNGVDVAKATERKIYVCNCKGMNATAVAEQAILLMLGLLKDVVNGDGYVRAGRQIEIKEQYMLQGSLKEMRDCTVGLVGFGDIAKATAKFAGALGSKVVYYDIFRASEELEQQYQATYMELDELLAVSDMVSIHLPLTKETTGIANKEFFDKMKDGAYLVNTARGELVDTNALIAAIASGKLAGAGLDTIANEPVRLDNDILKAPEEVAKKLVVSCHIGGITRASFERGYAMIAENMVRMSQGEKPVRIVNSWEK